MEQTKTKIEKRQYTVTPSRVGRHKEIEPFTIEVRVHPEVGPEDPVADAIWREVKGYLMSKEVSIEVSLHRGRFTINGGRFGGGAISEVLS